MAARVEQVFLKRTLSRGNSKSATAFSLFFATFFSVSHVYSSSQIEQLLISRVKLQLLRRQQHFQLFELFPFRKIPEKRTEIEIALSLPTRFQRTLEAGNWAGTDLTNGLKESRWPLFLHEWGFSRFNTWTYMAKKVVQLEKRSSSFST